jgi:hypothetical protein
LELQYTKLGYMGWTHVVKSVVVSTGSYQRYGIPLLVSEHLLAFQGLCYMKLDKYETF